MDNNIDPELPPAMDKPEDNTPQNSPEQNQQIPQTAPDQTAPDQNPQDQTPQPTASLNQPNGPTLHNTGVDLQSPVLGPTHFDGLKDPALQANQPSMVPAPGQTDAEKAKTFMILAIVFGALAFIGIIVGIWSLVSYTSTNNKLAQTQAALNTADAIISKIEEDTGATITSVDTVPAYSAVTDYIYVSAWGIKFEIPSDLADISYTVDQKYRPQICFNAYKAGSKYFPAFADIDQNTGGMGCVTRVASYEGDSDADTGASFGQPIYSYGDYNYFYVAPNGHYSEDAAEQGLEDTAVQLIKNMIVNTISHFE